MIFRTARLSRKLRLAAKVCAAGLAIVLFLLLIVATRDASRNTRYEQKLGCVPFYRSVFPNAVISYVRELPTDSIADSLERMGPPIGISRLNVPRVLSPTWIADLINWSNEWEYLNFSYTTFDDECLEQLIPSCRKLRMLNIAWTQVSSSEAFAACELPTLHTLILDGTKVDDQCMLEIARISSLRVLSVEATGVSNIGLARLAKLRLVSLDISGCDLIRPLADTFAGFRNLEKIEMDSRCATQAVCEILRQNNPRLEITVVEQRPDRTMENMEDDMGDSSF